MSIKKAITLARDSIKIDKKFIDDLLEYDRKNPDTSEQQTGSRYYKVVREILGIHIVILTKIIDEVSIKKVKTK